MQITTNKIDKVLIEYTVEDEEYPYQDTLLFTKEEYDNFTSEEIDKMIADKYESWKEYILS